LIAVNQSKELLLKYYALKLSAKMGVDNVSERYVVLIVLILVNLTIEKTHKIYNFVWSRWEDNIKADLQEVRCAV
jgi:hypothetical protein